MIDAENFKVLVDNLGSGVNAYQVWFQPNTGDKCPMGVTVEIDGGETTQDEQGTITVVRAPAVIFKQA